MEATLGIDAAENSAQAFQGSPTGKSSNTTIQGQPLNYQLY